MNSKKQIEDQVLEIGAKAKRASLKVSLLSKRVKNQILLDASKNLKKNKKIIIEKK